MLRVPPPIVSAASCPSTSSPARASVTAAARPFGPEPMTTARLGAKPGPVELGVKQPAVGDVWRQLPQPLRERDPRLRRLRRDRAHREDVRDPLVARDRLLPVELPLAQLLEPGARQRLAPRAGEDP